MPSLSARPINKEMDPNGCPRLPLPPLAQSLINFADDILVLQALSLESTQKHEHSRHFSVHPITHQGLQVQPKPQTTLYKSPVLVNQDKAVGMAFDKAWGTPTSWPAANK